MTRAARRPVGWIVVALATGTALSALNSGMIAVALSTLRGEFHVDVPTVTWVISAFYLASAVLQPLMGRFADRYGALRVFTVGMVVVAVAGAAGPFAPTLEWLCVVRVVLAVGTATAFPSAAAVLRRMARESAESPEPGTSFEAAPIIGRIQLIDTSAAAIGPVLGGALLVLAGWEALFWINIPLAAIAIVATRLVIPPDEAREHVPLRTTLRESDLPGVALFAVTVVAMLLFLLDLVDGPEWPYLAAAVVTGALFTWRELRAATPFIDLRLLAGNRPLLRVYGLFILANIVLYGTLFGIPYAFVLISITQSLYLAAPPEHVGQAAGLFQTARSMGSIAGATVVGMALFNGTDPEDWIILAGVVAASAVLLAVVAVATGRAAKTADSPR